MVEFNSCGVASSHSAPISKRKQTKAAIAYRWKNNKSPLKTRNQVQCSM